MNWQDASTNCIRLKGRLGSFSSQEEESQVISNREEGLYWIGMNDRESEGMWVWSDGSSVLWKNWGNGEPKAGADLNCGMVRIGMPGLKWFDIVCGLERRFICKKRG